MLEADSCAPPPREKMRQAEAGEVTIACGLALQTQGDHTEMVLRLVCLGVMDARYLHCPSTLPMMISTSGRPVIAPTRWSPGPTEATPAGVPVKMRSPGCSVTDALQ